MKIGIVGAGAMGSIFAYFLNKSDIKTIIYEKNKSIVDKVSSGLNVYVDKEVSTLNVSISGDPQALQDCNAVFLFVKSFHTRQAMIDISKNLQQDCIFVTIQNGIGNKEIISEFIAEDKIVYGSTTIGATKTDKNTVAYGGGLDITIGGKNKKSVEFILDILSKINLNVTINPNPDEAIWRKAIINAGINPIGALLEIPNGMIIRNEYASALMEGIIREAVRVASSLGIIFDPDDMVSVARNVCAKTAINLCSMFQDLKPKTPEAKDCVSKTKCDIVKKTEIESINGIIIEYGKKNSIPTPYNEVIYKLIKAKELI
jgi:2-dehydropantoate 2-reductase